MDNYMHYHKYHFDLPQIEWLFITHSHLDHFYPDDFESRSEGLGHLDVPTTLHIFGNKTVGERVLKVRATLKEKEQYRLSFHYAEPFKPIDVPLDALYRITPLRANHEPAEEALFYAVEKAGKDGEASKALLYAHDTGWFPDVSWAWLEKCGIKFDLISLDCTMEMVNSRNNHMGFDTDAEVRSELIRMGRADSRCLFVVNHFSHNGRLTQDELMAEGKKRGFEVACDGREFEF
jgi:phosphoribosyl 1,2-cyclic phosphate phosphodiesterase